MDDPVVFRPRIVPYDAVDCAVAVAVGTIQFFMLFLAPAMVVYLVTQSLFPACAILAMMYLLILSWLVRSVVVGENGIRFIRLLGKPKFLSWQAITAVEEVRRREVVFFGWLWPIFPAREMTATLTSQHHFKVRWRDGYCYFAPKEYFLFSDLVCRHRMASKQDKD